MTMPFSLPDWAPPWAGFALLVVAGLFGLAFLFMPFSVFGVKGRLDAIEVRLDEIQGEIRSLVLRLPEAGRADQAEPAGARRWVEPVQLPPIPPRTPGLADRPPPSPNRRVEPVRGMRAEPRFDSN